MKFWLKRFLKLKKETDFQLQKEQKVLNMMNPKKSIPRYIIIKMAKLKERNLKQQEKKQSITNKGPPMKRSADFSAETL